MKKRFEPYGLGRGKGTRVGQLYVWHNPDATEYVLVISPQLYVGREREDIWKTVSWCTRRRGGLSQNQPKLKFARGSMYEEWFVEVEERQQQRQQHRQQDYQELHLWHRIA